MYLHFLLNERELSAVSLRGECGLSTVRIHSEYILSGLRAISQCWHVSYCRYMLGLAAIPAVIQFLGFLFLPESPRWLIQKGQTQKARRILSQMRGNQTIDEEYDSIRNSIEEEEKEVGAGTCMSRCMRRRTALCFI